MRAKIIHGLLLAALALVGAGCEQKAAPPATPVKVEAPAAAAKPEPAHVATASAVEKAPVPVVTPAETAQAPAPAEEAAEPELALVGHWPLDEGDGAVAKDASGKGNDGTITPGDGGWSDEGPFGGSYHFSNSSIDCGSDASLDNLGQFTYTAWIKLDSFGGGGAGRILSKGTGPDSLFVDEQYRRIEYFGDRKPKEYFGDRKPNEEDTEARDGKYATPHDSIETGKWYFVVMSYDGTLLRNLPAFFINGELVEPEKLVHPAGDLAPDASDNLLIGNIVGNTRGFDGNICQVRVYKGILPSGQIQALYKEGQK